MKRKCTVKLTDVQMDENDRQVMEITTQGEYEWTENGFLLRFEGFFDEDLRSSTAVSSHEKGCVTILHRGDITTELTLELGKRHNSHYVTPYGELMIGIDAIEIESSLTADGGVLKLVYSIDYYAAVAAVKEITIEVTL